jgi:hypothetical protein
VDEEPEHWALVPRQRRDARPRPARPSRALALPRHGAHVPHAHRAVVGGRRDRVAPLARILPFEPVALLALLHPRLGLPAPDRVPARPRVLAQSNDVAHPACAARRRAGAEWVSPSRGPGPALLYRAARTGRARAREAAPRWPSIKPHSCSVARW